MKESGKIRQNYNQDILEHIQRRYGFSLDYIRKALRGDRVGILPNKIIEEYKALETETRNAIANFGKESV